ncbi:hypothetical protein [Tolypothrix sp. VBCCA 56010]|uniref:hypothetical protein n=1 Tax=Tolypothrix sp. VBCCA 56010 TaxID=3137731 RepID=UPI003D7C7B4A
MGQWAMGNGQWAMEIENQLLISFSCPMTAGATTEGTSKGALPPPCPMTAGATTEGTSNGALPPPCPMPHSPFPLNSLCLCLVL